MSFHVRITLTDVNEKPSRAIIAIGETVYITNNVAEILTSGIQRKYNEISYSLDQEEEEVNGEDSSAKGDQKAFDEDILA